MGMPGLRYRLDRITPPWGDYGSILLSGMTAHLPRTRDGRLRLERTGPFVPPITVAGIDDLLVTEAFRAALAGSPLAGFGFRPVEKARIVRLEWEHWDRAAAHPRAYPEGGEPENYILGRPHDPALAAQIGPIWEVRLPGAGERPDADLARAEPGAGPVRASQRARDWLEDQAGEWLCFTE